MNRREFVVANVCAPFLVNALGEKSDMTASNHSTNREIMWRRVMDDLSFEHARVIQTESGTEISGSVLVAQNDLPLRVDYCIACDPSWQTRTIQVDQSWQGFRRKLRLNHDGSGHWQKDGKEDSRLDGCIDVDLGVSPSTNALPVNRLRLPLGESREINAAWIRFPKLEVTPTRQAYHRLHEKQYRYRNLASGFTALIDVDDGGLPTEYAGIWQRVAHGVAAPLSVSAEFARALISDAPSTELGNAAEAFGWLIGGWAAQIRDFDPDGRVRHGGGEWWFSWALEGRAVQDVWISPPRSKRTSEHGKPPDQSSTNNRYGTTVRWFELKDGVWRIVFVNPVSGAIYNLAGKRKGDRVVLLGKEEDGSAIRWSLDEIRSDSFIFRGEERQANGQWRLSAEFQLQRMV
jgi:hypothetical protein